MRLISVQKSLLIFSINYLNQMNRKSCASRATAITKRSRLPNKLELLKVALDDICICCCRDRSWPWRAVSLSEFSCWIFAIGSRAFWSELNGIRRLLMCFAWLSSSATVSTIHAKQICIKSTQCTNMHKIEII